MSQKTESEENKMLTKTELMTIVSSINSLEVLISRCQLSTDSNVNKVALLLIDAKSHLQKIVDNVIPQHV